MLERRTLWLDFTTSLYWERAPVGIVRMEQECCRWLLTKWPDRVRICIFDWGKEQYLEIPQSEAWKILNPPPKERIAPSKASEALPQNPPRVRLARRLEQRLRKMTLGVLDALPERYRTGLKRRLIAVRRTLAFAYHEWKAARQELLAAKGAPAPRQPAAMQSAPLRASPFARNDIYLTMGLDWDHGNKMEYLYREKKKTGFVVVNVIHDVIPVLFPHFYQAGKSQFFARFYSTMAWASDHILCNSRCTARDLEAFLKEIGAPTPSMSVIREGDTLPEVSSTAEYSPAVEKLVTEPFMLFVSTIEIRKNHETLYKAYLRLLESGFDAPKLVFVGMHGWRVDDFMASLQQDPRVENRIVILHHINDAELNLLYQRCLFTLYPSLYEGWGLPVAESLAHGKFCLAANAASVPEIAGDIIDYADPWDVPAWAEKMRHYCSDPAALQAREQEIASRYRITSWETTTDQIMQVIDGHIAAEPRAS